MKKNTLSLLVILSAFLYSCGEKSVIDPNLTIKRQVIILNQGNYTEQNSSVYVYDEDSKTMKPNAFSSANGGTKLGATLMSGTFSSAGTGYLLCSNPDKIEVIDIISLKTLSKPITDGLSNVREVTGAGQFLFVTNAGTEYKVLPDGSYEYTNSFVSAYSVTNNVFMESLPLGSDAQGMAYMDGKLYVGTKAGIAIVSREGNKLKLDNVYQDEEYTGGVKYLCALNDKIYASVPGCGIFEYDPYKGVTTKRYQIPMDSNAYIMTGPDNKIYSFATIYNTTDWSVESSNVYMLSTSSGEVKEMITGEYIYGIGVSPFTGNIFAAEANGFSTNSSIKIVSPVSGLVGVETAGVGTCRFMFVSYLEQKN